MKLLLIFFLVHVIVCGGLAYALQERSEEHRAFGPPIETTTSEERKRGQASFLIAQNHTTIRFPGPLLVSGAAGLIALFVAFCTLLYRHITHSQ